MCGSACGACGIQARRKLPVCSMKLFRHPIATVAGLAASACAMLVLATWAVRSSCGMLVSISGCAFRHFAQVAGNGVSDHGRNADGMRVCVTTSVMVGCRVEVALYN